MFNLWILETLFHFLILSTQYLLVIFPLVLVSNKETKKDEKEMKSRADGFVPS